MIRTKLPEEFLDIFSENIPHLNDLLAIDGVFLAGGLLRTLIHPNEELDPEKTDVDLFFRDGQALIDAQLFLSKTQYYKFYQCPEEKLASYVYLDGEEPKWKIQLVTVDYYPTLESLIDSFDFTVTMYSTDGEDFVVGDTAIQDTLENHLVWHKITYPSSSLRRMIKYSKKGYWMREEDYQWFVTMVWEHHPDILDGKLVYVD